MNTYVDKYGLWNAKPVDPTTGMPSGNDGPIITAYAMKLGFSVDMEKIKKYFDSLQKIPGTNIPLERLPGKKTPYPSRDSILGWYWLGLLKVEDLEENEWLFSPELLPRFNLFKFLKEGLQALAHYKDRNYFWENKLTQLYRINFSVPIKDREYMLENSGKRVPDFYDKYEALAVKFFPSDSDSSRLIAWRKGDEKLDIDVFRRYFPIGHPYVEKLEGKI